MFYGKTTYRVGVYGGYVSAIVAIKKLSKATTCGTALRRAAIIVTTHTHQDYIAASGTNCFNVVTTPKAKIISIMAAEALRYAKSGMIFYLSEIGRTATDTTTLRNTVNVRWTVLTLMEITAQRIAGLLHSKNKIEIKQRAIM